MPRLRKRGVVAEEMVEEAKKAASPELEVPSASPSAASTKTAARTDKEPISKTKTLHGSSENKMEEATTPTGVGVVKKKPRTPPQPKAAKGGIHKSFRDRLQWRSTHCVMPPTSTPIRDPRQKFTKEDIETAFGFEEVEKTEYSTLVSPIAHASPKGINAPVWKIHPLSQRNVECGLPTSRNARLAGAAAAAPSSSSRTRPPPHKRSSSEEAKASPRVRVDRRAALAGAVSSPKSQPQVPPPTPPEAVDEKKRVDLQDTPKAIMGDIELPSIIEVTPPASSSSQSAVPSSSSEPSQTKAPQPAQVRVDKEKPKAKETQEARAVPLRRGRSKKKVDYSEEKTEIVEVVEEDEEPKSVGKSKPAATRSRKRRPASPVSEQTERSEEKLAGEPLKRPTRSTRSQKTARGTAPLSQTALKLERRVNRKVAPKESEGEVEIREMEADDEKEEHEVLLEAALPAAKAKRKRAPAHDALSKKKVESRRTKNTAPSLPPAQRPLLFENLTRREEKASGVSPFSQLVSRYKEEEMEGDDGELRVDPRKIVRTYTSRKRVKYSEERDSEAEYDFIPKPTNCSAVDKQNDLRTTKKSRRGVKVKGKKRKAVAEEDLDEETRKWLEQKNKEFEDVAKVKLVIEQSFSD